MQPDESARDRAGAERAAYEELQYYTLSHGDPAFVHQYVVDAWAAQHADERTKPIAITFALIGLYLHLVRGFNGRQVQKAHMALARRKHPWPIFVMPADRGAMSARDVMAAPAGAERDRAIDDWCTAVWDAYRDNRETVVQLLEKHGIR